MAVSNLSLAAAVWVGTSLLVWSVARWISHRRYFSKLPCPPSSWLFGNIPQFMEVSKAFPPQFHWGELMNAVGDKYNLPEAFCLDLWPLMPPFIIIRDGRLATSLLKKDFPKHPVTLKNCSVTLGHRSMLLVGGKEWKSLRSTFASAFSNQYLTTAAPDIIETMHEFNARLTQSARSGETFSMLQYSQDVTFDVISQIVLGKNFHCQRQRAPIEYHLSRVMHTAQTSLNPFMGLMVFFPQRYHLRKLEGYIAQELRERDQNLDKTTESKRGQGAAIDWLLNAKGSKQLSGDFLDVAISSVQTLFVGGHDTTASTFCHLMAYMVKSPEWTARIREEHDTIFGTDTSTVADSLRDDPKLLNNLPITTGCLKEALRLAPQGIFPRVAPDTESITLSDSTVVPLGHGAAIALSHGGIMRDPKRWGDDGALFNPARWLHDDKGAEPSFDDFRAFERANVRSCAGEQLAIMELKMLLVFVMRDFEFEFMYEESDPKVSEEMGGYIYQIVDLTAKPAKGLPMRVKTRENVAKKA